MIALITTLLNNKALRIIATILISIVALSIAFFFTYEHGVSNGVNKQKKADEVAYTAQLKNALDTANKRALEEKDAAVKLAQDQQQIKTVYVDRYKTVEKVIHDSKALNNPECALSDDELKQIQQTVESIK